MLVFRTLLFAFAALFGVMWAHPLAIIPGVPLPLPVVGGGGNSGGLLPLPIPGIGSVAPRGEVATGNTAGLSYDGRARAFRAICVHDGSDVELQKKQICYLGQNKLLPLAEVCQNVKAITKDEVQLYEVTYPDANGNCKMRNYSAECDLFNQFGILRGILVSIFGCKMA